MKIVGQTSKIGCLDDLRWHDPPTYFHLNWSIRPNVFVGHGETRFMCCNSKLSFLPKTSLKNDCQISQTPTLQSVCRTEGKHEYKGHVAVCTVTWTHILARSKYRARARFQPGIECSSISNLKSDEGCSLIWDLAAQESHMSLLA
jgi:hypothetical protein